MERRDTTLGKTNPPREVDATGSRGSAASAVDGGSGGMEENATGSRGSAASAVDGGSGGMEENSFGKGGDGGK
ncbi:hypothetical protein QE152_g36528 [Popillia japonica]|uniref:Uncharacterized protein n=1 Tax=Popillia japonica TaxID=7064 RepID=A0AAW1IDE0_POPJA